MNSNDASNIIELLDSSNDEATISDEEKAACKYMYIFQFTLSFLLAV